MINGDTEEEELEKKPVVSPIVQMPSSISQVKQEIGQVSVIRRLAPPTFTPSIIPGTLSGVVKTDLSKVIEETIGGDVKRDIDMETEQITTGKEAEVSNIIHKTVHNDVMVEEQKQLEEQVDIGKLVDVCFEEELQKPLEKKKTVQEVFEKPRAIIKETNVDRREAEQNASRPKVIQRVKRRISGKRRRDSASPLPLKKRRKMHHYPIALAINRQQVPYLEFTIEEEFRLYDLIARNQHLEYITYKEIIRSAPEIMKRMIRIFVSSMKRNIKIKDDEEDMDRMMTSCRELCASKSKEVFDEFQVLKKSVAYRVHYNSWPALQSLLWTIFESNAGKGMQQQFQRAGGFQSPAGFPNELFNMFIGDFPEMKDLMDNEGMRGAKIGDYALFISPWAQTEEDEIFFEKTILDLGKILEDDCKLSVIFQMLLMISTPPGCKRPCKQICEIQGDLAQLLYRYLSSSLKRDEASRKAHLLIGFLNKLHRLTPH